MLWFAGLTTFVPYATYYLLFEAPREQYALLITLVLFWIFGYWGVVGPLLAALKVRSVFRALEQAQSGEAFIDVLRRPDARLAVVELIASENKIPRFLAAWIYQLLLRRFATAHEMQRKSQG
ncbi:MAG TPA: hypothetical protein VK043_01875 [Burkholderiales bacterium]|nr:hypothetical protein [Burkholderiales bacterium]